MSKKKVVILIILVFLFGISVDKFLFTNKKEDLSTEKSISNKSSRSLSMMLETGSNTGQYELTTRSTWPTDGYLFNSTLSKCENGGTVKWDDENKAVLMSGNVSDKCYVYFDKYDLAVINNVTSTQTPSSITVTVSATTGTSEISKYMFSINNGEYQESSTNTYTFTSLNDSTSYIIKTKVVDAKGKESSERTDTISTTAYVNATINSLTEVITYNSIKVTVNATSGTKPISKYYYSSDGGSNYIESTSSTYTFTNLAKGTNYNIKTYVVDTNNNASLVYSKVIKTNITLVDYVKNSYSSQGANGLYYHDPSLTGGANDNSYRYAGADPDNYVCFGSDATTCPSDNLFRIIGVIDNKIKLVKNTYAGSNLLGTNGTYVSNNAYRFSEYYSCPSDTTAYLNTNSNGITRLANKNIIAAGDLLAGCNEWKSSYLNTINLNTNYLNTFGDNYKNKIANTIWTTENNNTQKIGLISYNDYKYICPRGYWDLSSSYSYKDFNWFYDDYTYDSSGYVDGYVTITKTLDPSQTEDDVAVYVVKPSDYYSSSQGYFTTGGNIYLASTSNIFYIKPALYLNANVDYISGTGEINSPIRLS